MSPLPNEEQPLSNRELAATVRGLKLLVDSLKGLSKEGDSAKQAVDNIVSTIENKSAIERRKALEDYNINQTRIKQERKLAEEFVKAGYSTESITRLLKDYNKGVREVDLSFKEYINRLKDAKGDLKEMASLTVDYFSKAVKGNRAVAIAIASMAFDADVYTKKAALIAGGPRMGLWGTTFTPEMKVMKESADYILKMSLFGKSVDESINELKKWNFIVREAGNTKYAMDAARASTAITLLGQVSESTANKLTETLMLRLGRSGVEVQGSYQKLIDSNRGGVLSNEQYVSSVVEMINVNTKYNKNIGYAIPIVKAFEQSIKDGKFSIEEISSVFSTAARMTTPQQAGMAMFMKQSGINLSGITAGKGAYPFARAGNEPFALATAMTMAGTNPEITGGIVKAIEQLGAPQGFGYNERRDKKGRDVSTIIDRLGLASFEAVGLQRMGYNVNAVQANLLLEAQHRGKLDKTKFEEIMKGPKDFKDQKLEDMASNISLETMTLKQLWGLATGSGIQVKIVSAMTEGLGDLASGIMKAITSEQGGKGYENFKKLQEKVSGSIGIGPNIKPADTIINLNMDSKKIGNFLIPGAIKGVKGEARSTSVITKEE